MYSQVLVPLDGSEASERALLHAQSLAHAFGARVHLLQIISLSDEYEAARGGGDSPTVVEYSLDMARQITTARQTRAETYLQAMAARRFLVGSVTDRVIRSSHVPVLAIPPED